MTQDVDVENGDLAPEGSLSSLPGAGDSLRQAIRRARQDGAERAGVLADLQAARVGRLELLRDALAPLVAQIPADIDMFDVALAPGDNPRLFIDMIGFVEMGRDARLYRLMQDTRYGRFSIAESDQVDVIVGAVTDYVARRILERDRAIASDASWRAVPARLPASFPAATDGGDPGSVQAPPTAGPVAQSSRRGVLAWSAVAFALLIDLLGSVAFLALLAWAGWYAWTRFGSPS